MSDTAAAAIASIKPQKNQPLDNGMLRHGRMLIDGEWVDAASGETFDAIYPGTGEVIARVAAGDREDVDRAAKAARRAFESGEYTKMNGADRGRLLWRIADLMEQNIEELAELETLNNGKPLLESLRVDLPQSIASWRYYAGWAGKATGETIEPNARTNAFAFTLREPVGVCGQIIPWNFPIQMATWKIAPAIACGNTVVIKPAEQTSLSILRLGELMMEAGMPKGVVNIVTGFGATAGAAIVEHPEIDKIAFTGSVEIGKLIMRNASSTLKKVTLELGGKSPTSSLPTRTSSSPRRWRSAASSSTRVRCAPRAAASSSRRRRARSSWGFSRAVRRRWSSAIRSIRRPAWARSSARSR